MVRTLRRDSLPAGLLRRALCAVGRAWLLIAVLLPILGLVFPAAAQPESPPTAPAEEPAEHQSVAEKILDILLARGTIDPNEHAALSAEAAAELEQARQVTAATAATAPEPDEFRVFWRDGLRMTTPDDEFVVRVGGRLHLDWAAVGSDDAVRQALGGSAEGFGAEIRRAWLETSGAIYRRFLWSFQMSFTGNVLVQDAWVGVKDLPGLGTLRIGNQKEPFSLGKLINNNYLTFLERPLYMSMLSIRNVGASVHNTVLGQRFSYAAGAFVNSQTSSYSDFNDWQVVARLNGLPLYDPDRQLLLLLGASYAHRFRSGDAATVRYRSRPEAHLAPYTVDTGDIPVANIDQIGGELALVYGPFSVQGEYVESFLETPDGGVLAFPGAYAQVSYFLTGESRPYHNGLFGAIEPLHPFDLWSGQPGQSGWGAWELAARWSWIDFNDAAGGQAIQGGEEHDITGGVNWYLNNTMRVMLNYVYARIQDRKYGGDIDDGDMHIVEGRFQVAF